MNTQEQWKQVIIDGEAYNYEVSNKGNVRNMKTKRMLKPSHNNVGYLQLNLYQNGKSKKMLVHRLVGLMFIPNDDVEHKTEINHISEDKTDNRVENLQWCDRSYNTNYGTRNKRVRKVLGKKIIGISTTNTKVIVLQSTRQAVKFGFDQATICKCCNGKIKTAYGFKWRYID